MFYFFPISYERSWLTALHYTSCSWKWTITSPASSVLFSVQHIHWAVAGRLDSSSDSKKDLPQSFPLYLGQSPVLSSPPQLAVHLRSQTDLTAFARIQRRMYASATVCQRVLYFHQCLTTQLFKMAYRKLQVAFSWYFLLLRKYDVCGKHIVTFRPQNILSSPKRASTESELRNTTRSELCKTNESHESKYDRTYLCTHIWCLFGGSETWLAKCWWGNERKTRYKCYYYKRLPNRCSICHSVETFNVRTFLKDSGVGKTV